jgi:hypothetical protein
VKNFLNCSGLFVLLAQLLLLAPIAAAQGRGTGMKAAVSLYSEFAPAQKSSIKAALVDKINSFAHKTWDWQCVDPTTASYGSKDEAQAVTLTVSISQDQAQGGANVTASVTSPNGTLSSHQLSVDPRLLSGPASGQNLKDQALIAAGIVLSDARPCLRAMSWSGQINYTYQVKGQAVESVSQSYSYDEMVQVMIHLERGMGTATSHAQQKGFAKNRQGALRNGAIINIETDSKTFEASAGGDATASVEVAVDPDGINYEIHPSWMPAAGKGLTTLCDHGKCQDSKYDYYANVQPLAISGKVTNDGRLSGTLNDEIRGGNSHNDIITRTVTWDLTPVRLGK